MHDRTGTGDVRGNTTDDQTSTRKLVQNYVSFVDKKPDVIFQDEAKMNETNEKLEKFKMGSGTKSIRHDFVER